MFLRAYLLIFAYKKIFTTGYNRLVESGLQIRISRQKFHLREFLVVFHQKDGETMGNSYHTLWYTYIYVRARGCVCVYVCVCAFYISRYSISICCLRFLGTAWYSNTSVFTCPFRESSSPCSPRHPPLACWSSCGCPRSRSSLDRRQGPLWSLVGPRAHRPCSAGLTKNDVKIFKICKVITTLSKHHPGASCRDCHKMPVPSVPCAAHCPTKARCQLCCSEDPGRSISAPCQTRNACLAEPRTECHKPFISC